MVDQSSNQSTRTESIPGSGRFSRRKLLQQTATTTGSLAVGGLVASQPATATGRDCFRLFAAGNKPACCCFPCTTEGCCEDNPNHDQCIHCDIDGGDGDSDDGDSGDNVWLLNPSGHNLELTGVALAPLDIPLEVSVDLTQGDVVAKGQATVRGESELQEDGTLWPPTSWSVRAATQGSAPLQPGPATVTTTFDFRHEEVHGTMTENSITLAHEGSDLIPTNFARADTDTVVNVENQGTDDAGPSTTEVDYGTHGTEQRATPALAPGETAELSFPIPAGCFDPDCEFTITVDVNDIVEEGNEENNVEEGVFIG